MLSTQLYLIQSAINLQKDNTVIVIESHTAQGVIEDNLDFKSHIQKVIPSITPAVLHHELAYPIKEFEAGDPA